MNTKRPCDWREARRLRAWELKAQGWKAIRIAEALGVSRSAVSQWFKIAEAEGVEALYSRKASGPKPRLSEEQLQQLPVLSDKGPEAHGFGGDVWTCKRVGRVIERHFGVSYTPQNVGKLLRKIGWSRAQILSLKSRSRLNEVQDSSRLRGKRVSKPRRVSCERRRPQRVS
jgi:transposase